MQYSKTFNILTIKIMKIFKFMTLALVAMLGFSSCSEDCDHEFIEHDFTKELVGTWTYDEGEQAEAIEINPDGSFTITGVMKHGALYEEKGTIKVVNNKVTLAYNSGDVFEGRLELVAGKSLSIVLFEEENIRLTYDYCKEDLSDEIIGMWVCMDTPANTESEMMIETFYENGKSSLTGFLPLEGDSEQVLNEETDYMVIGDLLFIHIPADKFGDNTPFYVVHKMIYTPNATAMGDIMTMKSIAKAEGGYVAGTSSWLRVKQSLNIAGKTYDYCNNYVSDVKGLDKDIEFMGYTMNFANMDGTGLDKMLKSLLFAVEFPDANTINYSYQMNGKKEVYNAPIVVDGNNIIIKMSEKFATLKDVVFLAFQDADDSQMHFFMHKRDFVNFYTNTQAMLMESTDEQFDINNAEAINAIYNDINEAVESINLSLIFRTAK